MKQYEEMKKKFPDSILLFRVGDFYETFCEDAIAVSEILGITLTKRANGKNASVELAGFPKHALDSYLPKLVRAGRRVAICEQLEDPKVNIAKRRALELVTPGKQSKCKGSKSAVEICAQMDRIYHVAMSDRKYFRLYTRANTAFQRYMRNLVSHLDGVGANNLNEKVKQSVYMK